jgi:glutathione S-transferase
MAASVTSSWADCPSSKVPNMSLHLIIGDKLLSSWSLRGALALELTGGLYRRADQAQPAGHPRSAAQAFADRQVPLLKPHGTIADSLAIAEYLAEQFPDADLWPKDVAARAQARSACAQMHAGFFAMRGNMPFDLSRDAPLSPVPPTCRRTSNACPRCGPNAAQPRRKRAVPVWSGHPGRRVFAHRRAPAHLSGEAVRS